jgi:hypothetical protein
MEHNHEQRYEMGPVEEDKTPIRQYLIELSSRDIDALNRLKKRNGAGICGVQVENIALWKMINQACELKNAK